MVFDEKDWMERMGKAQTDEEIRALVMELLAGPPMTPDDPNYFFMEPIITPELLAPINKI